MIELIGADGILGFQIVQILARHFSPVVVCRIGIYRYVPVSISGITHSATIEFVSGNHRMDYFLFTL